MVRFREYAPSVEIDTAQGMRPTRITQSRASLSLGA